MGSVDNVTSYLQYSDIGVLCSDKEGLSNAILEYMACGLPVVATDVGGNSELVDKDNGFLVPPGDPPALAKALYSLIESTELRRRMGAASLDKVKQNYTWEKVIPLWEEYYEGLVRRKNVR